MNSGLISIERSSFLINFEATKLQNNGQNFRFYRVAGID